MIGRIMSAISGRHPVRHGCCGDRSGRRGTPKQVVADLSNSRVDITSSYHGTELLLFGAYEGRPGDDIVLIVQGPPTDIIQRRKEKRAGIWVNGETFIWQQAPSFYHMFSTNQLDAIAEPATLKQAMVGPLSTSLSLVRGARGDARDMAARSKRQPVHPFWQQRPEGRSAPKYGGERAVADHAIRHHNPAGHAVPRRPCTAKQHSSRGLCCSGAAFS